MSHTMPFLLGENCVTHTHTHTHTLSRPRSLPFLIPHTLLYFITPLTLIKYHVVVVCITQCYIECTEQDPSAHVHPKKEHMCSSIVCGIRFFVLLPVRHIIVIIETHFRVHCAVDHTFHTIKGAPANIHCCSVRCWDLCVYSTETVDWSQRICRV